MTERERLIEILTEIFDEQYEKMRMITPQHTADHLLANGVIVPPVKVGDTVYQVASERVYESTVTKIIYDTNSIAFDERAIGKSIFLTREKAEEALRKAVEK